MYFFISAQDIRSITFALFTPEQMVQEQTFEATPERYLFCLNTVWDQWNLEAQVLEGVVVVTGPGSFTASRVSTTMANALAFGRGISVFGIDSPESSSPLEMFRLASPSHQVSVNPTYDRPAEITISKRSS